MVRIVWLRLETAFIFYVTEEILGSPFSGTRGRHWLTKLTVCSWKWEQWLNPQRRFRRSTDPNEFSVFHSSGSISRKSIPSISAWKKFLFPSSFTLPCCCPDYLLGILVSMEPNLGLPFWWPPKFPSYRFYRYLFVRIRRDRHYYPWVHPRGRGYRPIQRLIIGRHLNRRRRQSRVGKFYLWNWGRRHDRWV